MNKIKLSSFECRMAAQVGISRQIEALLGKFKDNLNNGSLGWNEHIEGAAAELAYAKYANLYWDGSVNTFKRPDVGNIQVRSTSLPTGCLIVRPKDPSDDRYVLVRGKVPEFEIVGSITGLEAKNTKFMKNPRGTGVAYFISDKDLKELTNAGL